MSNDEFSNKQYQELYDIFKNLFKQYDLYEENFFKTDVFFLKDDHLLHELIAPNKATPMGYSTNKMHHILKEISGTELKNMNIKVKIFIEEICKKLILCKKNIDQNEELIRKYNANIKKNEIEGVIEILSKSIKIQDQSILNISLSQIQNLPIGDYEFKFHISELCLGSVKDLSFRYIKMKNNRLIHVDNQMQDRILTADNYDFESLTLKECNIEDSEIDRNEYSGTNLSTFRVEIFRNKILFGSSTSENFFELFLALNDIEDPSKETISFHRKVFIETKTENFKNDGLANSYNVFFFMNLKLDNPTRISILNKKKYIFGNALSNKKMYEDFISEIKSYFPRICDSIDSNLKSKLVNNSEDSCSCSNCNIF